MVRQWQDDVGGETSLYSIIYMMVRELQDDVRRNIIAQYYINDGETMTRWC